MGAAFSRGFVLLIAGFLLSACQTTGADYAAVSQKVGPPRAGQARIVIMAEKGLGIAAPLADVKVDGVEAGGIGPGYYIYVDRPAGRSEIVASQSLFPGDTKRSITTASGRTYFFVAKASDRAKAVAGVGIVGGLAGALVAAAVTSGNENPGPVDLFPLDEAAARTAIAELQLAKR